MATQSLSWLFVPAHRVRSQEAAPTCRRCNSPLLSLSIGDAGYAPFATALPDRGPFCPDADCAIGEASAHVASVRSVKQRRIVNGAEVVVTVYVTTYRDE